MTGDPLSAQQLVAQDSALFDASDEAGRAGLDGHLQKGKGRMSAAEYDDEEDGQGYDVHPSQSSARLVKPTRTGSNARDSREYDNRAPTTRSNKGYGSTAVPLDEPPDRYDRPHGYPEDRAASPMHLLYNHADNDDSPMESGFSHARNERPPKQHHRRTSSLGLLGTLLEKDNTPGASLNAGPVSKAKLQAHYWQNITINLLFIAAWYTFSTMISLYNKWMFSPEHYNFGYPLFVTSWHMVVQFCLCSIVLGIFPSLRPANRPPTRDYALKVVPCGVATSLDIGLSNLSLKSITLSFYTMCKSSTLGFVLLFAFLFRLEKPTLPLIGIITVITGGVVMMVSSETQFHLAGMIEVLTASCLGGLRWSLTQMLLDKEAMGMNNPFATLFWLAPIMGGVLALCSMCIEGWFTIFATDSFASFDRILVTFGVILLPGVIAFSMNVAEFGLIQRTSVVTLSVAGIFKEVATIGLSTLVFHDQLTPINISGLCVALLGIAMYNYLKYRNYKAKEKAVLAGQANGVEMGDPNNSSTTQSHFRLIGENDLESSDEEDELDADAVSLKSIRTVNIPSHGSDYHEQNGHAYDSSAGRLAAALASKDATRELEDRVAQDPVLIDIEAREQAFEDQLDIDMSKSHARAAGGDLYDAIDRAKRE